MQKLEFKMNSSKLSLFVAGCTLTVLLAAGCGGPAQTESNLVKRARLIVIENDKLKKELADKNARMQELETRVATLEKENAEHAETAKDVEALMKSLMDLSATSERANEELEAENQTLKEELQKLKVSP